MSHCLFNNFIKAMKPEARLLATIAYDTIINASQLVKMRIKIKELTRRVI
jgi:hypothetical protein